MKNKIFAIFIALLIVLFGTSINAIADSGWDYDYDYGGGYSDWGSSSSYDYDYDYGSSSGDSDLSLGGYLVILVIVGILLLISKNQEKKNGNTVGVSTTKPVELVNDAEFAKYPGFNKDEFLKNAFDIYTGVQNAWSEFDYDALRKLTTDEMFNMYKMQLETLSVKNQKNIMKDFKKNFIGITSIGMVNGVLTVKVRLNVSQKDYIVNSTSNQVVRGNENRICFVAYELTFINNKGTGAALTNCPNCGAPVENASSQKCEYCAADLVGNATDNWVLAKKENIRQG